MTDASQGQPEKKLPPRSAYSGLNLPNNSKKSKDEEGKPAKWQEKNIKKIVTGEVSQRKPSIWRGIRAAFTGDDSRTVGNYVLFEVAIPAFKNLVSEGVSVAIDRLLFGGESRGGARRGYTPYNRYSSPSNSSGTVTKIINGATNKPNPRAVHNFDDIVLDNRGAAEEVIDALDELIKSFDVATVGDFYQLVGLTPGYNDENWGWSSMVGARAQRVPNGYAIILPRTQPLD